MSFKRFVLTQDATEGLTGGIVAQGCIFENGKVALAWISPVAAMTIYDSIDKVEQMRRAQVVKTTIEWVHT